MFKLKRLITLVRTVVCSHEEDGLERVVSSINKTSMHSLFTSWVKTNIDLCWLKKWENLPGEIWQRNIWVWTEHFTQDKDVFCDTSWRRDLSHAGEEWGSELHGEVSDPPPWSGILWVGIFFLSSEYVYQYYIPMLFPMKTSMHLSFILIRSMGSELLVEMCSSLTVNKWAREPVS